MCLIACSSSKIKVTQPEVKSRTCYGRELSTHLESKTTVKSFCKIGFVIVIVVVIIVGIKIAKSGDLGTWLSCKCNESVKFGEKLALVYVESSSTAYKHQNNAFVLAIIALPIKHAHYA